MKKWLLKSFVSMTAIASVMQFTGCSDTKTDFEDEEEDPILIDVSSSSSDKGSSSSLPPDLSDDLTDVDQGQMSETNNVSAPSSIKMDRLAPSVFQLSWEYSGPTENLSGFLVQRQGPTANEWEDVGALAATVSRLVIDGSNNMDYSYRLAAFYGDTRSPYSESVLVSRSTDYLSELSFPVVPQVVANIDRDSLLEFVLTGNYPSQSVQYSVYNYDTAGNRNGELYYEARFVYGSSYSVDTVKFSLDQGVVSKKFKSIDDQCNSFGQIRVVWKDKNGSKDYGDWTTPIGTKTGTTDGLSGDIKALCADVVVEESGFASPKELQADNAAGVWMLQWTYDEIADHPAAGGFAIQRLDLEKSAWVDVGQTGAGVLRFRVGMPTESYNYYRVAAIDKDKKRSAYSGDVLITVANAENVLNVPKVVGAVEYSKTQMTLSWTYEENTKRPISGFRVELLNMKTNEWTSAGKVGAEIRKFLINVASSDRYYRVVAYDAQGEVASADFEIPANAKSAYALAAPVVGPVNDLSDAELSLSWTYTDNEKRPATGFVIQSLDLTKGTWGSTKAVSKSVKIYKIAVADDARYMRVGAYEGGDTVYAANEWFIPGKTAQAAVEVLLATPSMKEPVLADGKISLSWSYTNSAQRPAKNMDLQVFEDNAWKKVASVGLNTYRYTVEAKDYERYFRVVAFDARDSSYSNDVKVAAKSAAQATALAAPVFTDVQSVSNETQSISWTYTANSDRPVTGFIVQYLTEDAGKFVWKEKAVVKKDIRRYIIEVSENNQYWRIAAYDDIDTVFSNDKLVEGVVYKLAAPSGLKPTIQKDNSVVLSWEYNENAKKPASFFRIEQIDVDAKAWNTIVDNIPTTVKIQQIPAAAENRYFRVVAYVEAEGKITDEASSETVLVEATASVTELLPAPSGVDATILASGKAKLTWSYSANAARPAVKFMPQWSADAVTWTDLAAVDSTVHTASVVGPTEAQGGLYYRVAALDKANERSFSAAKYVEYQDVSVDLPAPTMAAPEKLSNGYYSLSWSYTAAKKRPAVNFKIYKLDEATNKWKLLEPNGTLDIDVKRLVVKPEAKDAYYRVSAVDKDGEEAFSNDVKVAALDETEKVLVAPAGVSGNILASGKVKLTWTYAANKDRPAVKFNLQRSVDAVTWTDNVITDTTARVAEVAGPTSAQKALYYRVAAVDADGVSSVSSVIYVEYKNVTVDLPAPTMGTPSRLSDGNYSLSWTYSASKERPATGFQVYAYEEKDGKLDWQKKGSQLAATTFRYTVSVTDHDVYYRVAAVDADGEEAYSNDVMVEALVVEAVELPAPTLTSATLWSSGTVHLEWNYSSDKKRPAEKFLVEYYKKETSGWVWKSAAEISDANVRAAEVAEVPTKDNGKMYYRIAAVDKDGAKSYSNTVFVEYVELKADLNVPASLSYTELSTGKISISWSYSDNADRPAEHLELQVFDGSNWTSVAGAENLDVTASRFEIASDENDRYFRVCVEDAEGKAYSSDLLVPGKKNDKVLNAPSQLAYKILPNGDYELSWAPYVQGSETAVGLQIEYGDDGKVFGKKINVDVSVSSYILDLDETGTGYYRITAVNEGSLTASSNAIYIAVYSVDLLNAPSEVSYSVEGKKCYISWKYTQGDAIATSFEIQTSTDGSNFATILAENLSINLRKYVFDVPSEGTYYRVVAKAADKKAGESEAVYIGANVDELILNAPVLNASVDMNRADGRYAISWTYEQGTLEAEKFVVKTSKDGNDWTDVGVELDASVTSYVFDAPTEGLYYRVEAEHGDQSKSSNAIYVAEYTVDLKLPVPANFVAERLSPSVWVLKWNYTSESKRPETGFRLQSSTVSVGNWKNASQTNTNVLQKVVMGNGEFEKFYRVAAYDGKDCSYDADNVEWSDGCRFSDNSEVIQLTESTPYRSDLNFNKAPELNVKGVSKYTKIGDNYVLSSAQVFVAVMTDQVAKTIINLPYTEKILYEFRVVHSDGTSEVLEREYTPSNTHDGGELAMKFEYPTFDDACFVSNGDYVQVRAKWVEVESYVDPESGETVHLEGFAYTEWSDLYRLGDVVEGCDTAK